MPSHTQIQRPRHLTAAQLDDYLANGWYRIGQTLMTCRFLVFEEALRATIWTRLPLAEHSFRRGQRKHLNRLRREFRVQAGPLILDDQREALYQVYRQQARGERSPTLRHFLYEDTRTNLFQTQEISVWRGDTLVAFSWFDLGDTAVQSLIGAYDPAESRWGLGYASLLLEVEWAMRNGFAHHYSGYILPGEPAMDYKLRAGELEWLTYDGQWRPWSSFDASRSPLATLDSALTAVAERLRAADVPTRVRDYTMFEAAAYDPGLSHCITEPRVAELFPAQNAASSLFVTYDLDDETYRAVSVIRATGVVRPPDPTLPTRQVDLFVHKRTLTQGQDLDGVTRVVLNRLKTDP